MIRTKLDTMSPAILAGVCATIFTKSDETMFIVVAATFVIVTAGYILIMYVARSKTRTSPSKYQRHLSSYLLNTQSVEDDSISASNHTLAYRALHD
jgi:predicted signal transduction protein with EAL and GGDEF domain